MNIDIKTCVGKKIAYKTAENAAFLDEGIVEQIINENTVKISGNYMNPNQIIVCAILGDSINESDNRREHLIIG
jgi:hypothetical protein